MPFDPNSAKKAGKKSKRGPAKKQEAKQKSRNVKNGNDFATKDQKRDVRS